MTTRNSSSLSVRGRRHIICKAQALAPGERLIVEIEGRSVGVFNVAGQFYALHNRCPHVGGALCQGPLTGTSLPTDRWGEYVYGREGHILRCAWHGWEFEVATGQCLAAPNIKAKSFPVTIEQGDVIVHI